MTKIYVRTDMMPPGFDKWLSQNKLTLSRETHVISADEIMATRLEVPSDLRIMRDRNGVLWLGGKTVLGTASITEIGKDRIYLLNPNLLAPTPRR